MKNLYISISLVIALIGCSPRVTVDKTQTIDFNHYKTYGWMDSDVNAGQNPLYYNQLATQRVEQTVNMVLSQRGLDSTKNMPDLLVGYHFFVEDKTRLVTSNPSPTPVYGPYYGWGRWGYRNWRPSWWSWNTWGPMYSQEKYEAGTVVIDMVDAETKQLIWRGSVQSAIVDPARISDQLQRDVQRIIEQFPQRKG
ncbi:DUF4136 domain-containing protein [Spirosoma aureum]|uniref:DUF4136 domain-containing protein n=1 Tax=Spirosoma aureum TaxID=2692134 RepID=A0A6G9AN42_9BACT|nr:DUF4136 domain-containing protein [Spirosoma aureum]QIP13820.1 DUF4136 domain-containing protein [Spirosoma aureum]